MEHNKFCEKKLLTNESSVESLFVAPLLAELGYSANDISYKTSISEIAVGKGSKKVLYKPDYVLKTSGIPTVVIDAKSPNEIIEEWEHQCSSYCLELNKFYDYNPVQIYILTNGIKLNVYQWDRKIPIISLTFDEFSEGENKYTDLIKLISRKSTAKKSKEELSNIEKEKFTFEKTDLVTLSEIFQKMHNIIWRSEKKSPSAAFHELIKIVFVKIQKDRQLHEKLGTPPNPKYLDVIFSSHWISNQSENESPINDPLFRNLVQSLEKGIAEGTKKRLFDVDEKLEVSASTIRRLVKEIEHIDFFAMEEDIHGRMFEAFLDATIRGKDIGQFFTPRDIVQLMVKLAAPKVTPSKIDRVLDACCGSGGFLIESMREMLSQCQAMVGISSIERDKIAAKIKNESLYGIDAGSDPAMYRIARMNMYLHGDGGSNIYYADSLDKKIGKIGTNSIENDKQIEEVRNTIIKNNKKFDIILSNPPFSLMYSREDPEQSEILNQYDLSVDRKTGKLSKQLPSSVLFIERYKDLVDDSGTIVAIIDDSVLSGDSYEYIRDYIRENFLVKAVISLPGDCFQRASARVKTSILVLKTKSKGNTQNDVFMAAMKYIGIEEKTAKRIGINVKDLEKNKKIELSNLITEYQNFSTGIAGKYVFPFKNIENRIDVKYCVNDRGRKRQKWLTDGLNTVLIGEVLKIQKNRSSDIIAEESYQMLRVTYDGNIIDGDLVLGVDSSYSRLQSVQAFDILISNIGVGRGAVGIVPKFHAGKWVSNEYTILRAQNKEEAVFYTSLLRTKEVLGDILATTTGMNRGRIKWEIIATVEVPQYLMGDKEVKQLVTDIEEYWQAHQRYVDKHKMHVTAISDKLGVDGFDSIERWLSYKPPE